MSDTMRQNIEDWQHILDKKASEKPEYIGEDIIAMVDVSWEVTSSFHTQLSISYAPLLTTKNVYLWVFIPAGREPSCVEEGGRWLRTEERAKIQGVPLSSIENTQSPARS